MSQICNMDKVSLSFYMPILYPKKESKMSDFDQEMENCNFTIMLCVSADSTKCNFMLILKRITILKENFQKNIIVKANPAGWMTKDIFWNG